MRRYSKKEMDKMSGLAFAKDLLQDELNNRDNCYSPIAKKISSSIGELEYMEEAKLTYPQLRAIFMAWEHQEPRPTRHLNAYIVFKPESWPGQGLGLASRTYAISSDNKAYQPNMGSHSIYGSCLDRSDPCVRLEQYMAQEYGDPKVGWQVDYCILLGQRN